MLLLMMMLLLMTVLLLRVLENLEMNDLRIERKTALTQSLKNT